jgi:6-phosphogluconolactonase (cycloisomerase 2 family)
LHVASRILIRRALAPLLLGLFGTAAAVLPAAASASDGSGAANHVYVNDSTAGTNTIAAFDRHANGTLTRTPGSPFKAGGAGTGTGLASQGAIQVSPDGQFVLAVDAGSNQISVLRVRDDGTLKQVAGGTVSSGGARPVSIAIHGNLVYVANAGDAASNYTGFRLGDNGRLTPIAGSTIPLPAGSQPGDVLFNSTGTKLVGTRVNSSLIDSFVVGADGRLTAAPGSPYVAQGLGPFGSEFRPTNPDQLFVSNAHNGPGAGTVSAYDDSALGELTSIGASPFANNDTAPCWIEITPDGSVLFSVNTAGGTISRYSIADDGSLTLLGNTPVGATGGLGAVDAQLTPDGSVLYVDESRVSAVGAFAVDGGNLTELTSSPFALPAGATPAGIAVR